MKKLFPALLLTAMIATGVSAQNKTDMTQGQTDFNHETQTSGCRNRSGKWHSLRMGFDLSMTKSLQTRGMKFQSDALDLTFGMGGRLNLLPASNTSTPTSTTHRLKASDWAAVCPTGSATTNLTSAKPYSRWEAPLATPTGNTPTMTSRSASIRSSKSQNRRSSSASATAMPIPIRPE